MPTTAIRMISKIWPAANAVGTLANVCCIAAVLIWLQSREERENGNDIAVLDGVFFPSRSKSGV